MTFKKSILIILPIFFALLFSSCQTDDIGGNAPDEVAKFLGQWSVLEQSARLNYDVIIERDPVYSNRIVIHNFADASGQAIGLVVDDKVIIDMQDIGGGFTANGEGLFNNNALIKFEFDLNDGIDLELRKASFTK